MRKPFPLERRNRQANLLCLPARHSHILFLDLGGSGRAGRIMRIGGIMTSKNPGAYGALLGLSGLFAAAAVATLFPNPTASWENVLGYKSLCTFAPIATAICCILAGATCVIRARLFGPRAGDRRSWALPLVVGLALAAVVALSIPPYARAKADALSGATAQLEE